jgi:CDGSH-type Zn-finger protein
MSETRKRSDYLRDGGCCQGHNECQGHASPPAERSEPAAASVPQEATPQKVEWVCRCGHSNLMHTPGGICIAFRCHCASGQAAVSREASVPHPPAMLPIERVIEIIDRAKLEHAMELQRGLVACRVEVHIVRETERALRALSSAPGERPFTCKCGLSKADCWLTPCPPSQTPR